ncbi:CcoQ/FixQ family Cbb3-type cytochrome c oxidase assembly chaperone [Fluviicola taffensis]|uniref:CcoQ/FixQ family Cbb3-type cytochrome c oxidase assembly chaperone n=1 Tax=Fluviicola taffensis TaxID=191579 RepID=UPI00313775B9
MLRFIKHHLATESGVEFYGIFSLMIFVLFFLVVLIRISRMKKSTIEELSNIPLGTEESTIENKIP